MFKNKIGKNMHTSNLLSSRKRLITSLALNIFIVITEIIGLTISLKAHGISSFKFYTEDSNIFALIACAIYAIYTAICLKSGKTVLPQWVRILKHAATLCLAITFVVVIFILSPMAGPGGYKTMLLYGSMLYHHLICPIAAIIAFIFFDFGPPLTKKQINIALIPTFIYSAIVLSLNIAKVMVGPYPFLRVYEQPVYMSIIWFGVILGGAYLLAWLLLLANKKSSRLLES
jgi:hypothetical protein